MASVSFLSFLCGVILNVQDLLSICALVIVSFGVCSGN